MRAAEKSLEEAFLNPDQWHRPLIIWQWMDGLVTKEGITNDLEAFKAAALAGVHNFQIGGSRQMQIGDADNKIGSDNWKELVGVNNGCQANFLAFLMHKTAAFMF